MAEAPKDPRYTKIIDELKAGKDPMGRGRPLGLTPEIYQAFITYITFGASPFRAAIQAGMNKSSYSEYLKSKTFTESIELAENNVPLNAEINIGTSIVGTPARTEQRVVWDKQLKKDVLVEVQLPAIPGDVQLSERYLQRKATEGKEPAGGVHLPAPRNEEEAELMTKMLNWHYDYVNADTNKPATTEQQGTTQANNQSTE